MVSPCDLEAHGQQKWDAVLGFMVGGTANAGHMTPPEWVQKCLILDGLMEESSLSTLKMSSEGFQFLLDEPPRQLWTLMLAYTRLKSQETAGDGHLQILSMVCRISCMERERSYPLSDLSDPQRLALTKDFAHCGMVYVTGERFYPTPLGLALSGVGVVRKLASVIVEKNFRVYIHVDNPVDMQVSLLSLFSKMEYTLPNVCAALLTRRTIFDALTHGVEVDAIIKFLEDRAHPCMRNEKGDPCLPYNVCKQLRLWADERARLTFEKCMFLDGFTSEEAFLAAEEYAKENGAYVYGTQQIDASGTSSRWSLAVHEEYTDEIVAYIKSGKGIEARSVKRMQAKSGGGGGGWNTVS